MRIKYQNKSFKLNKKTIKNLAELKKGYNTYNELFVDLINLKFKTIKSVQQREKINYQLKQGYACPQCEKGVMIIKQGRWGSFLACDQYPNCFFTQQINNGFKKYGEQKPKNKRKWFMPSLQKGEHNI